MESILVSIKKLLGIGEDYECFDKDIIVHINSVFSVLTQLGIGPENGFLIEDESQEWTDFLQDDTMLSLVKSYIYLRVKLLFDPPQNSFAVESINRQVSEFEWRLNVIAESYRKEV